MNRVVSVRGKHYDTGDHRWKHGDPCMYDNGYATHIKLGPCPDCGKMCFDYGCGWRCVGSYCNRGTGNMGPNVGKAPDWWKTNVNVMKDGNAWCAYFDGFINLQESTCAFGDHPQEAVDNLMKELLK